MEEEKVEGGNDSPEPFEERRKAYRLNKVLGATIEHGDDVTTARLFVIDISVSGFRATSHVPMPEGEDVTVTVALGAENEISTGAKIVWQKELTVSGMFQLGCEFQALPEEAETALEQFIEAERTKAQKPKKGPTSLGRPWTMIKD